MENLNRINAFWKGFLKTLEFTNPWPNCHANLTSYFSKTHLKSVNGVQFWDHRKSLYWQKCQYDDQKSGLNDCNNFWQILAHYLSKKIRSVRSCGRDQTSFADVAKIMSGNLKIYLITVWRISAWQLGNYSRDYIGVYCFSILYVVEFLSSRFSFMSLYTQSCEFIPSYLLKCQRMKYYG